MKKLTLALFFFAGLASARPLFATTTTCQVKQQDIYEGYIVQKIWLSQYAVPDVALSAIGYAANVQLPAGAHVADPNKFTLTMGMERKKPFVVVRIPAYVGGTGAGVSQVSSFTLTVNEKQASAGTTAAAARTTADVPVSVLNTGTWYKIAVTQTGFYKLDYNFISSLGIKPSSVNPANIQVYGNGGNMLSENNSVSRPADLIQNALQVSDNGDNVFDNGEYAVFYAVGPTAWFKDSTNQRFTHQNNLYTDTAYYFVTFDKGPGLRIAQQPPVTGDNNITVNTFNYYDAHEVDLQSPTGLGKLWLGEQFNPQLVTSETFTFNVGQTVGCVYCNVALAGTSPSSGDKFSISLNGSNMGAAMLPATTGDNVIAVTSVAGSGACNASTVSVGVSFAGNDPGGVGYLDYIEINTRRSLAMISDQMSFRDWQSVGGGNIANFQLGGANASTAVWDVTNPQVPQLMKGSLSGSTYNFNQTAASLHEFAAMNSTNLYTPKYVGVVPNQNLHGMPEADLIIVAYPDFLPQAQQLAAYHLAHDHMRVAVATTTEVYNEFSSGGQDLSAIRDFAKMFYDRAGSNASDLPSNLLLFGGASYDYKNRLPNNSNFVPVFESAESTNDLTSFSCDDFYGFLDNTEYIENNALLNALDIGVGRLPARNANDATALVNKIMAYATPATLGPWRIMSTYVACRNDDAGQHMLDAEAMASTVTSSTAGIYNEQKVYEDAIPVISTPAGGRCPNANTAINDGIYKGTFLINYNGHGNTEVWSSDRILTEDDYNNWNNNNMLPFVVTATCDYGQFDHPQFVSAAEQLVLKTNGGVIAILTTTEAVFAVFNHELNVQYLAAQFTRNTNGSWNTFGEASRIGKNQTYLKSVDGGEIANFRKFSLLGDPAVTPDFPEYNIALDSITDGFTQLRADTVKALGAYTAQGTVRDLNGNIKTDFNGMLSVSFFDKARTISTITSPTINFKLQDNLVYKGRVTVTNGLFTFTFIAPKDINYFFGTSKVSAYADNGITDAAGSDTTLTVGGYSDHPVLSSEPPVVKAYINDSLFLNGGITGSNTSLFVSLYDETGINVSGNDIGHDLTAVLDGNLEAPYILNDYYETAPNTYKQGYVSFPLLGLADGRHTITVKAWDVNDNTGEGTVDFMVVDGKVVDIQNLMNYPNPFSGTTTFVFEHNHPDELLDVQIGIYAVSGSLVKTIKQSFTPTGSRTNEITWDGTGDNGERLSSGVYVYRFNMTTASGVRSTAYQKLVISR